MLRRPRQAPLSRLKGATPTRAATCRREQRPSSGNSASKVAAVTGPMPGMLWSQVARGRRVGSACTTAAERPVRLLDQTRQHGQERVAAGQLVGRQVAALLLLGHARRDQLVPAAGEGLEPSLRLRERGAPRGAHLSREPRQHASIQLIGLGEGAEGAGEVADLARIDHNHRQVRQGGHHRALIPTAGFQHHAGGLECGQPVAQPVQAAAGAPYRPGRPRRVHSDVQAPLRHIDPDVHIR